MEATMVRRITNDDEENAVGGLVEKAPHLITAVIAVGGLIAAYFMTIGDFKMKDMELQQRLVYLEQKVERIDNNITTMQTKLEQRFPDMDKQQLKTEIDNLKEVLAQTRQLLQTQQKK